MCAFHGMLMDCESPHSEAVSTIDGVQWFCLEYG